MTRQEIEAAKEADLWADIPDFPREDWQTEAGTGDTQLGYWDWVESQLCQREEEDDTPNEIDNLLNASRELVYRVAALEERRQDGRRIMPSDWAVVQEQRKKTQALFEAWDKEHNPI